MTPTREHWTRIAIALSIGLVVYITANLTSRFLLQSEVRCALYQQNRCVLDADGNMARLK